MKVFLGGTCNNSKWRSDLIPLLEIDYFNPIVEDWSVGDMDREILERKVCDYLLYVITPRMLGSYSIAEVVDDSNKRPDHTIFCILDSDSDPRSGFAMSFDVPIKKSLDAVAKLVASNGAKVFSNLKSVAEYLNAT